jgi:hypothetical protein
MHQEKDKNIGEKEKESERFTVAEHGGDGE